MFQTLPLRSRKEDIIPLASRFLRTVFRDDEAPEFDSAVREYLVQREYPGNVRELRQLVQRIAHRHVGPGPITVGDIPEEDRPAVGQAQVAWPDEQLDRSISDALALGASRRRSTRQRPKRRFVWLSNRSAAICSARPNGSGLRIARFRCGEPREGCDVRAGLCC